MSTTTDCGCDNATTGCDCFGNGVTIPTGPTGDNGLSAYEVWLALGNTGTEADFITSLTGPTGPTGATGPQGPAGTPTPLVWNALPMNGVFTSSIAPNLAEYSIDEYGILRFRGRVSTVAGPAGGAICDMSGILTSNTKNYEIFCLPTNGSITLESASLNSNILSSTYVADEPLSLVTIPHMYILD